MGDKAAMQAALLGENVSLWHRHDAHSCALSFTLSRCNSPCCGEGGSSGIATGLMRRAPAQGSSLVCLERASERHKLPQRGQANEGANGVRQQRAFAKNAGNEVEVEKSNQTPVHTTDDNQGQHDKIQWFHGVSPD